MAADKFGPFLWSKLIETITIRIEDPKTLSTGSETTHCDNRCSRHPDALAPPFAGKTPARVAAAAAAAAIALAVVFDTVDGQFFGVSVAIRPGLSSFRS
jgi:hypothetical protein